MIFPTLLIISYLFIYWFHRSKSGKHKLQSSFELSESQWQDLTFYKFLETTGTVLSVKQNRFSNSILIGLVFIMLSLYLSRS